MAQPLDESTPDVVLKSIFKFYDKDDTGKLDKSLYFLLNENL